MRKWRNFGRSPSNNHSRRLKSQCSIRPRLSYAGEMRGTSEARWGVIQNFSDNFAWPKLPPCNYPFGLVLEAAPPQSSRLQLKAFARGQSASLQHSFFLLISFILSAESSFLSLALCSVESHHYHHDCNHYSTSSEDENFQPARSQWRAFSYAQR